MAAPDVIVVGAGVMTKGLTPLFFYPPLLWLAWRRRREMRFPALAFFAGLATMLALLGSWLIPYSRRAPVGELQTQWSAEILKFYTGVGLSDLLEHVLTYPLMLIALGLPWTLYLLFLRPEGRRSLRRRDPSGCSRRRGSRAAFSPGTAEGRPGRSRPPSW